MTIMALRREFTSIAVHIFTKEALEAIKTGMEEEAGFKMSLNAVVESLIDIYQIREQ
jgi:hypothetical protein